METHRTDNIRDALANHLILDPILNKLDLASLKTARLVCHSWFELASPILLRKSCLRLRQYNDQLYHSESFLASISKDGEYYISNVKLTGLDIKKGAVELFSKIGPWIDDLELTMTSTSGVADPEAFKEILYRKLPNVRKIALRGIPTDNNMHLLKEMEWIPSTKSRNINLQYFSIHSCNQLLINWVEFFTIFPHLKEFHMFDGTVPLGKCVLEAMSSARKLNPESLKLQKLSMTFAFFNVLAGGLDILYSLIRDLDFPLDGIILNLHDSDLRGIRSILGTYSETLQEVELYIRSPQRFIPFISKPMKCLRRLGIDDGLFANLDFLENTKNLSHLTLEDTTRCLFHNLREWSLAATGAPINCNLSSLHIKSFHGANSAMVEAIGKSFPNLRKLSLHLDDDGISMVFKYLKNLEELTIMEGSVTDFGLTGLQDQIPEDEGINRTLPYIGDLTKLKRFQLGDGYFENITDISIRYGLMDLKDLRYVGMPRTSVSCVGLEWLPKICRENCNVPIKLQPLSAATPNSPIRFYSGLSGEVNNGTTFSLFGFVHADVNRIAINLHMESGIAFHFNPRWDEGVTVLNSNIGDTWGNEEKIFYPEMYPGIDMSVRVACQSESFLVEVNDFTPITFKYRVTPGKITGVEVTGGFDVDQVYVCY